MKVLLEIHFEPYYRFLAACDPTSRDHEILKSGVEASNPKDPHDTTVAVLCESDEANRLLELAKLICPAAALDIATSIELKRVP